jgi:hypothetical protein
MDKNFFHYADFDQQMISNNISALFPGWMVGDERVVIFCPHDDDGALGAGYAIQAVLANGGQVYLVIFCDGWAGYSTVEEKGTIIEHRRAETLAAYAQLGVPADHIYRFNLPDFSLLAWNGWQLPDGQAGTMARELPILRQLKVTRLLLPNDYREHLDHEAAYQAGVYGGPQVGDPVIVDVGSAPPIRSYAKYAVWGNLSPEDALANGRPTSIRANRAIIAPPELEQTIASIMLQWQSQAQIISGIMTLRQQNRVRNGHALELYQVFDPRPPLDYKPYHDLIAGMDFKFATSD